MVLFLLVLSLPFYHAVCLVFYGVSILSAVLLLILSALVSWVPAALANSPVSADDLLAVLRQPPAEGQLATRADFAAMLGKAAAIPQSPVKGEVAKDVAPDAWYAGAVDTLKEKGIMSGYPNGTLQLERPVTRTEAVVLVARTFGLFTTISSDEAGPVPQGHWAGSLYNWMYSHPNSSPNIEPLPFSA